MAMTPFFFGYGSLVNRETHAYGNAHPARLPGWRRIWQHAAEYDFVALSVRPAGPNDIIDGLVAEVPNADWSTLDLREAGYERCDITRACRTASSCGQIQIYQMQANVARTPGVRHPIALSYLDIVVEGYLTEFGDVGVREFFRTTDGWEAPILDDRRAPIKARLRQADPSIYPLVDAWLDKVRAGAGLCLPLL